MKRLAAGISILCAASLPVLAEEAAPKGEDRIKKNEAAIVRFLLGGNLRGRSRTRALESMRGFIEQVGSDEICGYRLCAQAGAKEGETWYLAAVPSDFGQSARRTFLLASDGKLYEAMGGKEAVPAVRDYLEEDGGKGVPGAPFVVSKAGESAEADLEKKNTRGRMTGNEISAIKGCRACLEAAAVYRKLGLSGDTDGDGNAQEYPIGIASLTDGNGNDLISLVKTNPLHGYRFEVCRGQDPQGAAFVIAIPEKPGVTGKRVFVACTADGIVWAAPCEKEPIQPKEFPWDPSGGPGKPFTPVEE